MARTDSDYALLWANGMKFKEIIQLVRADVAAELPESAQVELLVESPELKENLTKWRRVADAVVELDRENHFFDDSLGDPATCSGNHNHPETI